MLSVFAERAAWTDLNRTSDDPLHLGYRATIPRSDPDGEIVAVNVQGDVQVAKGGYGWVTEASGFHARQDYAANGFGITWPTVDQVARMERTQLILGRPSSAIVAHGDQRGEIRRSWG